MSFFDITNSVKFDFLSIEYFFFTFEESRAELLVTEALFTWKALRDF